MYLGHFIVQIHILFNEPKKLFFAYIQNLSSINKYIEDG
jgi:hypothetical protein